MAGVTQPATSISIAEGQQTFQSHACFACHGTVGQGTARGPALAGFVAQRSDVDISNLLRDPNAKMRAGGMSPLIATPEQVSSLIAYLRTLTGTQSVAVQTDSTRRASDSVSSSAETSTLTPMQQPLAPMPNAMATHAAAAKDSPGRAVFVANGCAACHGPSGGGTSFAPSLIGITHKYPGKALDTLLRQPNSRMRDGGMPAITVNDSAMQELISYLSSLDTEHSVDTSGKIRIAGNSSMPHQVPGNSQRLQQAINAPPLSPEALRGKEVFHRYACESCHGVDGLRGTVAAPGLGGTASVLPAPMLENLLRHHSVRMQRGGMPLTNMNAEEMKALVAYIRSLPDSTNNH
jgi:mono/diheme cytochrome c family protein